MALEQWTLLDSKENLSLFEFERTFRPVREGAPEMRVELRTLQGGLQQGVQLLEIQNGPTRVFIVPQRGMGIWQAQVGDIPLSWQSPVRGPVHPAFVPLWQPDGLGWLMGFDEFLVRCGLQSNGAPQFDSLTQQLQFPMHGRIANLPPHHLTVSYESDNGAISVTGRVREAQMFGFNVELISTITLLPGENGFAISDEIKNNAGKDAEIELLYHINFGLPFVQPGARIRLPLQQLMPRDEFGVEELAKDSNAWSVMQGHDAEQTERVYFCQLACQSDGKTQALVHNADASRGVSLHIDRHQLPVFTLWKNTPNVEEGYVVGLEPGITFPNPQYFESRCERTLLIEYSLSNKFDLRLEAHLTPEAVEKANAAIDQIQQAVEPKIFDKPQIGWTMISD